MCAIFFAWNQPLPVNSHLLFKTHVNTPETSPGSGWHLQTECRFTATESRWQALAGNQSTIGVIQLLRPG